MHATPSARRVVITALVAASLLPSAGALPWFVGTWELTHKLDPATAEGDLGTESAGSYPFTFFGSEVAIDGDTMVVSTVFDRCDAPSWVYVFERSSSGPWQPTTKLFPSDGEWAGPEGDCSGFGSAIALDADEGVIVVGNPSLSVPGEKEAGAVYVFEASDGEWSQTARFIGPVNGEAGEWPGEGNVSHGPGLGEAVAVDDGVIVAGAPHAALDPPRRSQGLAEVYERDSQGSWVRTASVTAQTPDVGEHFAAAVALQAGTLVAGIPGADEASVYTSRADSLQLETVLEAPTLPSPHLHLADTFGFAVDIEGDHMIVGAPSGPSIDDVPVYGDDPLARGMAAVYDRTSDGWSLGQLLSPADGLPDTMFGKDVAVDGDLIVVGAPHWPEFITSLGAAYAYENTGQAWYPAGKILTNETSDWDELGASVDVSDRTIVTGAPFDDNRRDGTPYPLNDQGDIPGVVCGQLECSGVDEGEDAGSVFVFEPTDVAVPSD